jgi:hypothetical protein
VDRATFSRESALNRQAYVQLREHIRREYEGQFAVLAQGKLIGGARTFDPARALVERLERVLQYYLIFPADSEPNFDLVYDLASSAKDRILPPVDSIDSSRLHGISF